MLFILMFIAVVILFDCTKNTIFVTGDWKKPFCYNIYSWLDFSEQFYYYYYYYYFYYYRCCFIFRK